MEGVGREERLGMGVVEKEEEVDTSSLFSPNLKRVCGLGK